MPFSIMAMLKLYGLTALAFVAIDAVWLGVLATGFYQRHLGHLLRAEPLWPAAVAFYSIYIVGVIVFAVLPGVEAGSLGKSVALGAFLGFMAYATFDLTAWALFREFPPIVVAVDLVWGSVLTAGVAAAGFASARWLNLGAGAPW